MKSNQMIKVTNIDSGRYVTERKEFKGSNLYGHWHNKDIYVVYSYGTHWPLFIWYNDKWYENSEKYSPTTSKQQNQARPWGVDTIKRSCSDLKAIINKTHY